MKKKALVLALVFAGVLVSVSIEAGVRPMNGMRLGNGMRLSNGLSVSPTGLDFTTISHHRLGK
jgi:hypothetical protein